MSVTVIIIVHPRNLVQIGSRVKETLLPLAALHALLLAHVKHLQCLLSSLDTTESHGTESGTHTVGTVNLRQLHAADDETRCNLASTLDNGVFGNVHVEATHATQSWDSFHGDHTLDAEGTKGTIVASGGDNDGRVDGVGVHAGLVVMVHGDEGPVGDNTSDLDGTIGVLAGDQVLNGGGVELEIESVCGQRIIRADQLTSFTLGNWRTLLSMVLVKRAACLTVT